MRLLLLLALAFAGPATPPDADWLNLPRWDEGLAEVSLYEGRRTIYGAPRDSTLELITVREHFDPEKLVKTHPAPGKDVLPVMKLNLTRRTRTGVYEYVQMASAFVHRGTGELVKLSTAHMEWCGNSSAVYQRRGDGGHLFINSYMDDTGVDQRDVAADEIPIFADGLLLWLRQNLRDLEAGQTLTVAPSLLTSRPAWGPVAARIEAVEPVEGRLDGRRVPAIEVRLVMGDRTERFTFADDDLRILLSWEDGAGDRYELRKTMFLDYWNRSRSGDEELLR